MRHALLPRLTNSHHDNVTMARPRVMPVFPTPLGPSIAMAGASGSSSSNFQIHPPRAGIPHRLRYLSHALCTTI